jgi:hypothetical protein
LILTGKSGLAGGRWMKASGWSRLIKFHAVFPASLFAFTIFLLPLQSFWAEYTGAAQEIEQNLLKLDQKGRIN